MEALLERALFNVECTVAEAQRAAGDEMVRTFRYLLSTKRLVRHKLSIRNHLGLACLHVNDQPWFAGNRGRNRHSFRIVQLLDDIDLAIEKCDDDVIKSITGVIF